MIFKIKNELFYILNCHFDFCILTFAFFMLNIKIDKFQGPLNLLLQLIEKEEMDITQISLAKIADQYVNYIKNSPNIIKPDDMADFLVVAARLLLIKSRALLPYLYPEEEQEIEEFEQQLKMYKEFLDAMKGIEATLKKKKFMFAREFNKKAVLSLAQGISFFAPPKKLSAEDLSTIFKEIINSLEPKQQLEEEKLEYKVNIEDKIIVIQKMLINRIKVSFNKLLNNTKSKTEVIVSFLAMLELIKQRDIVVNQDGLFKEMVISKVL